MICDFCGCPGAEAPVHRVLCVNRGCRAYHRQLREELDRAVGLLERSLGFVDPKFNGARVSVIAKWLEERDPLADGRQG